MKRILNKTDVVVMVLFCALASGAHSGAQQAAVTGNARVDHLLYQMTLDEKIAMIHGAGEDTSTYQGEAGYLPGIKRLGIPPIRFADGPPGVLTRVPSIAPTCTMGVAATFSREDARLNGTVIGREARSHGIGVALQPFINIDRDLSYGRGYNTFGEDPFLTGEMGAAEVRGIQAEGVMAQAKHYIGYDTNSGNVFIDDQALHEVYLAPFVEAAKAGVSSIMCSYNKINGQYSCGNADTIQRMLKDEVGFAGFVTSDWGATHATDFINAGLDMEMPGPLPDAIAGPSYFVNGPKRESLEEEKPDGPALSDAGLPEEPYEKSGGGSPRKWPESDLKKLIVPGLVSEITITRAAGRVLLQMDRFGYLDGKEKLDVTPSDISDSARIVEKTAIDAAVLLKNEGGALPLKTADLADLAMIGPGAGQTVAVGNTGEKAVGLPELEVGPLAALRELAGEDVHITYAVADDMEGTVIPAKYFSHFGEPGLERRVWKENAITVDNDLNFTRTAATALPANESIVWTGTLTIPNSGNYRIHLQLLGCYGKLEIDDTVVDKNWFNWIHGEVIQPGEQNIFPTTDGLDNLRAAMDLSAGPHRISIEVAPDSSNNPVQVRVSWVTPSQQAENYRAAIDAARHAKTVIVFAWSRTRPVFELPGDQDKLIRDVAQANPNTIVVLNVSQPIAMSWLSQVKAVLQMWWTGDKGGPATAKLLLGKANPGGRLPFTWPRRLEDTPAADPAFPERSRNGVDGKTTFSEGILIGYRWFDRRNIEPLFPFGFGLSFTTFTYSGLRSTPAADGGFDIAVNLSNTGSIAGDEVAQAYLEKPASAPAGVQFADRILAGFERIHLAPGESKQAVIHVAPRQLEYWSSAQHRWVMPAGDRIVWVGGSLRDRKLETHLAVRHGGAAQSAAAE
ncbi:MAG: glycoside hydrolase family 3 C-terminal domain-containing protein [Terracidiphilus sp.]